MFDETFNKSVRAFCRKSGWTLAESHLADFTIVREPFSVYVLLGPELFDRRFPNVNAIYLKRVYGIRERNKMPSILVMVRDINTISIYENIAAAHVAFLHFDDLAFLNFLTIDLPAVAPVGDKGLSWAIDFVALNSQLCKRLSRQAGLTGDPNRALLWAQKAVAANNLDPMVYHELGKTHAALGNLSSAEEAMTNGLRLAPDSAVLLNQASRLAARQNRAAEALAFAQKAVETPNHGPNDYNHLARLYLSNKEFEAAETAARRACALNPDNAQFAETLKQIEAQRAKSLR